MSNSYEAASERAQEALRSYEKVGEGDWTPQDARGEQCARDVITLADALAVLRWKNNDGTYEDNCWCAVKSVDLPGWHSPQCEAVRAILSK